MPTICQLKQAKTSKLHWHFLQVGKNNRSVGATLMNQDSSRSHSVFTITIETIEQGPASVSTAAAAAAAAAARARSAAPVAAAGCCIA
jgi:hypothetical protein